MAERPLSSTRPSRTCSEGWRLQVHPRGGHGDSSARDQRVLQRSRFGSRSAYPAPGVIALEQVALARHGRALRRQTPVPPPTVDELENERLQAEALEQARQDANSDLDAFTDALRDA